MFHFRIKNLKPVSDKILSVRLSAGLFIMYNKRHIAGYNSYIVTSLHSEVGKILKDKISFTKEQFIEDLEVF